MSHSDSSDIGHGPNASFTSSTSSTAEVQRDQLLARAHEAVKHLQHLRKLDAARLQEHQEKYEFLESNLAKKDEEIESLREKIESFRTSEARLVEENRRLTQELQSRGASIKEKEGRIQQLMDELDSAEEVRKELEHENQEAQGRLVGMSEVIEKLKERASEQSALKNSLNALRSKFQSLSSTVGRAGAGKPMGFSRRGGTRTDMTSPDERLAEAKDTLRQLRSTRDDAIAQLCQGIAAGVGGGEAGEKLAKETSEWLHSLFEQLDEAQGVVETELRERYEDAEHERKALHSKTEDLSQELDRSSRERQELATRYGQLEEEHGNMSEDYQTAKTELRREKLERNKLTEERDILAQSLDEARQSARKLSEKNSALQREVATKEENLRLKDQEMESISISREERQRAQQELGEARQKISTLSSVIAQKEEEIARLSSLREENETLKTRYVEMEEAMRGWKHGKEAVGGRDYDDDDDGSSTPLKDRRRKLRAWSHIMDAHEAATDRLKGSGQYWDSASSAFAAGRRGDSAVPEGARRLLACQAEAEALPSRLCRELLAEICAELGMSSVRGCVGVAQRVVASLSAVPRLERFVKDLNALLFCAGESVANRDAATTAILPHLSGMMKTLQSWQGELVTLRQFKKALSRELNLHYQPEIAGALDARADLDAFFKTYSDERSIIKAVTELIASAEKAKWSWASLKHSWERYGRAAAAKYEAVSSASLTAKRLSTDEEFNTLYEGYRTASLLKHLLSTTSMAEVVPKVQQLFEDRDRGRVFVQSLKALLGLRDDAGFDDVIEHVRRAQVAALLHGNAGHS